MPSLFSTQLPKNRVNIGGAPRYAHTILPRATKFGNVTDVGERRVSWDQPCPNPKGRALTLSNSL